MARIGGIPPCSDSRLCNRSGVRSVHPPVRRKARETTDPRQSDLRAIPVGLPNDGLPAVDASEPALKRRRCPPPLTHCDRLHQATQRLYPADAADRGRSSLAAGDL